MNTLKLAKQMTSLLEERGWDINDTIKYKCKKCVYTSYSDSGPYCSFCGERMENVCSDAGTQDIKEVLNICLKGYEIKKRSEKMKKVVDKAKK